MKRSPLKRTKGLNKVSKKKRLQQNDERAVRQAYREAHPYCEAKHHACNCPDRIPGDCYGSLSIHEPWTRARGGPTDDPKNMRVVCFEHNRMLSQDAKTMEWGIFHGFLVKSHDGARWLAQSTPTCDRLDCNFHEEWNKRYGRSIRSRD